jgi:hypothetical protein
MKASKLTIAFLLLGLAVAASFVPAPAGKEAQNIKIADIQCNHMEESRLKVALQQCADLVTSYTWGELDKEKYR